MPSNFNRMYSNSMALISWLTWGGVVERQRPGPMERSQGPNGGTRGPDHDRHRLESVRVLRDLQAQRGGKGEAGLPDTGRLFRLLHGEDCRIGHEHGFRWNGGKDGTNCRVF